MQNVLACLLLVLVATGGTVRAASLVSASSPRLAPLSPTLLPVSKTNSCQGVVSGSPSEGFNGALTYTVEWSATVQRQNLFNSSVRFYSVENAKNTQIHQFSGNLADIPQPVKLKRQYSVSSGQNKIVSLKVNVGQLNVDADDTVLQSFLCSLELTNAGRAVSNPFLKDASATTKEPETEVPPSAASTTGTTSDTTTGASSSGTSSGTTTGASSSGTSSDTTSGPTAEPPTPPPLKPSPDIMTAKVQAKTLYFEQDAPAYDRISVRVTLNTPALTTVSIYTDAYDPKSEDNSGNLVRPLLLETQKERGAFSLTWDGYDEYDQPTALGKYKFVVESRINQSYKPDISIQSFEIVNAPAEPPEVSQPDAATGEAATSAASEAAGATIDENLHGAAEENPAGALLNQLNQAIFGEGEGEGAEEKETVVARVASKCPNTFYPTDIAGHPYEALIKKAYDECLVRGYADGTFRAEQGLTRAEATKIAVLASGKVAKQGCYDADCGSPFEDLEMWHGPWVRAAWDLKIVSGVGKNMFAPNRALTRAEAVALVMKAFQIQLHYGCYNTHCGAGLPDDPFTDIVQMWQGPYLRALWDKGVLHTLTPGRFYPDQAITRGQFIELVYLVKSLK